MRCSPRIRPGASAASRAQPETRTRFNRGRLYTLAVQDGKAPIQRDRQCRRAPLRAGGPGSRFFGRMADPATRIVSLTITEKGYCHIRQPTLDERPPGHRSRSRKPARARSAMASSRGDSRRVSAGIAPFRCFLRQSSGNGHVLKRIVTQFANWRSGLADVIASGRPFDHGGTASFRPPPTATGVRSQRQWGSKCLADHDRTLPAMVDRVDSRSGRPDGKSGSALRPRRLRLRVMKLRLLNGSHSTLAYLGYSPVRDGGGCHVLPGMEAWVEG